MAYIPSINDINEISNYQPTLSDALETHAPPTAPQSIINQIANSAPVQGILGAGDAIRNFMGDIGGMLPNPFMDLSKPVGQSNNKPVIPSGAGTAYNVGNIVGNIGTFIGGGDILDTARAGIESLPYIGKAAQYLGGNGFSGALRQGLGSAGYGAVTTPQNRTGGAEQGGLISAGLSVLPGAAGLIGKGINAIRPQQYSDAIIQGLGGGKSLEGNAQSLAQDLQNSYQQQVKNTGDILNPIFDSVGSRSIYDSVRTPVENNFKNPDEVTEYLSDLTGKEFDDADDAKDYLSQKYGYQFPDNKSFLNFFNSKPNVSGTFGQSQYLNLDKDIPNSYDRNISGLHQNFIDNPTLQNAHDLQSQLGTSIGKLQSQDARGNLSVADRSTMQGYQQARGALRSDMTNFLNTQNPNLASQYQMGTDYYRENVAPYLQDSSIAQIAKGKIINPENVTSIFKNPEPYMQKIVGDMGSQANNKILYAQLGKNAASLKPEQLISQFQGLDKSGLGSYVPQSLSDQMHELSGRISARNNTQRGVGALAGLAAMHPASGFINPEIAGVIGAGLGGAFSPAIMRGIQGVAPIQSMGQSIAAGIKKSYPFISNSIKANTINGGQ